MVNKVGGTRTKQQVQAEKDAATPAAEPKKLNAKQQKKAIEEAKNAQAQAAAWEALELQRLAQVGSGQ